MVKYGFICNRPRKGVPSASESLSRALKMFDYNYNITVAIRNIRRWAAQLVYAVTE